MNSSCSIWKWSNLPTPNSPMYNLLHTFSLDLNKQYRSNFQSLKPKNWSENSSPHIHQGQNFFHHLSCYAEHNKLKWHEITICLVGKQAATPWGKISMHFYFLLHGLAFTSSPLLIISDLGRQRTERQVGRKAKDCVYLCFEKLLSLLWQ